MLRVLFFSSTSVQSGSAWFLSMVGIMTFAFQAAALEVTFTDISPDQSDHDATAAWGRASGGRVNGLAIAPTAPQRRFAASEWGGLYRSLDGGLTWHHLDGHLPTAMWDVEVDPTNANRVYATSFFDGRVGSKAGISVSTDGGATWTRPASATPPPGFCASQARRDEPSAFGIAIDPNNSQNVYLGTNCGLARSTDRGLTWTFLDPTPANGAGDVWDVVIHHNGIIDLCGDDGHRRSVNGGNTWTTASSAPAIPSARCSIAVSPDEPHVLFVVSGTTIYDSRDGGLSWSTTYANPAIQGRIPFVEANDRAGNAFNLWFGDVSLFRADCTTPAPATPGGSARCPASNNWVAASADAHNDAGAIVFNPQVSTDACPELYSSDGGVYFETSRTSPACHAPTWEQPTITPHGLWLFDLDGAHRPGVGVEHLYMSSQDNGTFHAGDAPAPKPSWSNRNYGDSFDFSASDQYVVFTQLAPWHLYVAALDMTGGREITGLPGNLLGFQSLDTIDSFGSDDFVLVTSSGVYITQNIAANPVTWTQLGASTAPANVCSVQASVPADTPTFIVKAGGCNGDRAGSLWRFTGTGAGTWQRIERNGVSQFGIYTVDPQRPNRLFASDLAGGNVTMVLSEDGGNTWKRLSGVDALMTANGAFVPWNTRGPTNFTSFNGYPQPTLVAFDPEDPDILVAGAADAGVFLSTNRGQSWELVTDPHNPPASGRPHLPRPRYAYFDHEPGRGDVHLYLGTQGRGVWRLSFTVPTILAISGRPVFLRVHPPGTGYGASPDVIDGEVVVKLDTAPDLALGFQLRADANQAMAEGMLNQLRAAFADGRTVLLEYEKSGLRIGALKRVIAVD
jgi:photosystem II stability/assembly factor-like uncharacterized protein